MNLIMLALCFELEYRWKRHYIQFSFDIPVPIVHMHQLAFTHITKTSEVQQACFGAAL